jgi:hypothetical protein
MTHPITRFVTVQCVWRANEERSSRFREWAVPVYPVRDLGRKTRPTDAGLKHASGRRGEAQTPTATTTAGPSCPGPPTGSRQRLHRAEYLAARSCRRIAGRSTHSHCSSLPRRIVPDSVACLSSAPINTSACAKQTQKRHGPIFSFGSDRVYRSWVTSMSVGPACTRTSPHIHVLSQLSVPKLTYDRHICALFPHRITNAKEKSRHRLHAVVISVRNSIDRLLILRIAPY